jgi:hypothetical protein
VVLGVFLEIAKFPRPFNAVGHFYAAHCSQFLEFRNESVMSSLGEAMNL